jgi:alpha-beta hydrolase superfamily lysophospholipase
MGGSISRGWRVRAGLFSAGALMVGVTAAGMAPGTAWADSGSSGISSVPVSFRVVLRNDSGIPCDTSNPATSLVGGVLGNQQVTVRGHLTGPSGAFDSDHLDGTLYSHGDGYDERFWRFTHDENYNYVDEMAHRGHVSVTIDRLGYGDSSAPNGNLVCYGTEATVLHQIIGQLREGHYQGDQTPRFNQVGLVGHSASGLIVEQEAAGFHDIHALGVLDSGTLAVQPLSVVRTGEEQARCVAGVVGPGNGYAPLESDAQQFRDDHLYNVEQDIADYLASNRTLDACAGLRNAVQGLAGNAARDSLIQVPVLVLGGSNDRLFQRFDLQAKAYTQSPKVSVQVVPDTGHAVAFSREHQTFYDDMNNWLDENHL